MTQLTTNRANYTADINPDWTPQMVFQAVKTATEKECFPSLDPKTYGKCLYRNSEGKACAFGIFIKDEEYKQGMEMGVRQLLDNTCHNDFSFIRNKLPAWSLKEYVWKENPYTHSTGNIFWYHLQSAHDYIASRGWDTEKFLEKVRELYKDLNFETGETENVITSNNSR